MMMNESDDYKNNNIATIAGATAAAVAASDGRYLKSSQFDSSHVAFYISFIYLFSDYYYYERKPKIR